jgi:predicted Zn-dependent protease
MMNMLERVQTALLLTFAPALCLAGLHRASIPLAAQERKQDQELEMGQKIFDEMKASGEIVESSPLYNQLGPIADAISRAAQPQYNHPFKVYLIHEDLPDAYAAPGGNIYVVDSLLYFVGNADILAGVLCHEVSHTIHHDSLAKLQEEQEIEERETRAVQLLGANRAQRLRIPLIGMLHSLGYSRYVEERADLTGSGICATAGFNPWGLVWLFQDLQDSDLEEFPELLSDHPAFQHRVSMLKLHFLTHPLLFGKFSSDPRTARPLTVPKNASEKFLQ